MIPPNHTDDKDLAMVPIGTVAELLGVSLNTLRTYEAEGLILPGRTASNQRRYSRSDITRISCIRKAIQEEGLTIQGIKRIQALIPCWDIVGCSESERHACEAYRSYERGCWTYRHKSNVCAGKNCRDCPVYRSSGDCSRIKELLVRHVHTDRNQESERQ